MNNNLTSNEWDSIITNAPYNTLNLPPGDNNMFDEKNPQESSLPFQMPMPKKYTDPYSEQRVLSDRIPTGSETNFYDPTSEMVNNYLKTNISMYDNRGKYFDQYLFNQKFDQYIKEKNAERILKEKAQTYDLDRIDNIEIQPYQLPLNKLLINFKNVWFELFDNIINFNNPLYMFNTDNFFYFGISLVVIFLLYIMLSFIFE
jgi:hypothetical protein